MNAYVNSSLTIISLVALTSTSAVAGPNFPLPVVPPHGPAVIHLYTGPGIIPPVLGPIGYADGFISPPDPHHWEIELHNPSATAPMSFNLTLTAPANLISGNLTLGPLDSVYWDIHYPDVPEVGFWSLTATNPGALPVVLDTSVIEHNFPGAGPAGPLFLGAGGGPASPFAGFGPVHPGLPDITGTIVPEPAVAGLTFLGLAAMTRRRSRPNT